MNMAALNYIKSIESDSSLVRKGAIDPISQGIVIKVGDSYRPR